MRVDHAKTEAVESTAQLRDLLCFDLWLKWIRHKHPPYAGGYGCPTSFLDNDEKIDLPSLRKSEEEFIKTQDYWLN